MPDANRRTTVERISQAAIERPAAERGAFLDSVCAGDAGLRDDLQSLLVDSSRPLPEKSALSWVGRRIRNYEILGLVGAGGRERSTGRATRHWGGRSR